MEITPIPHEFLIWEQGAPVICINSSYDFVVWSEANAPVVDIDETWNPSRRRADSF